MKPLASFLLVLSLSLSHALADDSGFTSIFDGKTLTGWEGNPKLWSVQDGTITGTTTDEDPIQYNQFLIWSQGEVDDFELKLEYKIKKGNSGIQYRSFRLPKDYSLGGYQADFEAGTTYSGINYGEQFRGILAKRGERTEIGEDSKPKVIETFAKTEDLQEKINQGEWNTYHIIAKGNHMIHKINGVVMSDVTDNDTDKRRFSGVLAFQVHKGPAMKVQFRNIRLKRLPLSDGRKKIVFVAGKPSHGPRLHEHNAGSLLLARLLNQNYGDKVLATVYQNGWPTDPTAFQNADSLVMFSDGQKNHVAFDHRDEVSQLAAKGIGIGAMHYAVEMLKDDSNQDLISWIGGAFEIDRSVNPHWTAHFDEMPKHPVANGVAPFELEDEWYFNMRFAPDMKGVTPILSAIPDADTMARPDGAHSGNAAVRKMVAAKTPQHVCWVYDRADGGRGFGFTGTHFHDNLANDSFRKTLLNAICWISKAEVPEKGIQTTTPSKAEFDANLDPKPAKKKNK
ncbi:MAG: DUF1080 domain-containing protein [Verrucomicrobiales bacterium]|nr:DUF1080 domain-containing protein [Verrucomicrobiales bacterium]